MHEHRQSEHGYDRSKNLIVGTPVAASFVCRFSLNEIPSLVDTHTVNIADLVTELNSVTLVGGLKQLGSECGGDELSIISKTLDHGYRITAARVHSLPDAGYPH